MTNNGSVTAKNVNVQLYTNTDGPFGNSFVTGSEACEVMPAPTGFDYAAACQFEGSISASHDWSFKADFGGTVGAKFTNLATVGELQGDANVADNQSTVSSWFGPRADLGVSGTAAPGTKTGHLSAVTTVVNHGPNAAGSVQEVVEIKNLNAASASGSGTCQPVPPASGYGFAFSCVLNSLATGGLWKLTFDYRGTSGATATMVTTVSALTKDLSSTNNTMTRTAKVK